jgi:hypothetical protein
MNEIIWEGAMAMIPILDVHLGLSAQKKDDIEKDSKVLTAKNSLVEHLNKTLYSLQDIRGDILPSGRAASQNAFDGSIHTGDGHWYIFNKGGRQEIQYNAGMTEEWFRVGLGLYVGKTRGGDNSKAMNYYKAFRDVISDNRSKLRETIQELGLKVQWEALPDEGGIIANTWPSRLSTFLIENRWEDRLTWLFLGKIWIKGDLMDDLLMEDAAALEAEIDKVCRSLWPFYEQTHYRYKDMTQKIGLLSQLPHHVRSTKFSTSVPTTVTT